MIEANAINIVFASDDHYASYLAVSLRSIVANISSKSVLSIFVIDAGIRTANRNKIESVSQSRPEVGSHVFWVEVSDKKLLNRSTNAAHISSATYLRLHAPELLPESVKKFLYVDVDTITLGDVSALWEIDMCGVTVAAVQDWLLPYVSSSYRQSLSGKYPLPLYKEYGHNQNTPYFNAGLLLIDRDRWKNKSVTERVYSYINSVETRYADQDGLNAILASDWRQLDPSWNVTPQIVGIDSWPDKEYVVSIQSKVKDAISNVNLVHYVGARKPWLYWNACPLSKYYYDYETQVFGLPWERLRQRVKGAYLFAKNVKHWI